MKVNVFLVIIILLCSFLNRLFGQENVIPLYSDGIPNSKSTPIDYKEIKDTARGYFTKISVPTLTLFKPKEGTANGTAVIILPSGGYRVVVDEGADIAKEFTKNGVTAFVLKYRLPSDEIMIDKSIGPLQDAQQAIKLIRMKANDFNIDVNKIGFVGLSAGGHLATTEATHLDTVVINNKENINLRPDFLILIYPVISFTQYKVSATISRLLGENPAEDSLNFFSNEKNVKSDLPPVFLLHASDDDRVPVQHSLLFFEKLQIAKVKSELHILPNGGHAFALEHPTRGDKWFGWCIDWLKDLGFVSK